MMLMKQSEQIALIGFGCRFPRGANTPEDLWAMLVNENASIETKTVPVGSLQGYDYKYFDNRFFAHSIPETECLDPQQRMLLEVTHETLESAAIPPASITNVSVGVYIGLCNSDFQSMQFWNQNPKDLSIYSGLGSSSCTASGRVSRFYNFHGPSLTIDTACSSSLVAIHQACIGLKSGDCDMALAGGANAIISPQMTAYLSKLGVLSSSKKSIAFDHNSDGYIRAEGCGMVALKRLEDAIRDHDRILGVIRGSSVNHDGRSSSFTAPNAEAQAVLIQNTIAKCGLTPSDIDYVETHGTGTPLGDLTEIQALFKVFADGQDSKIKIGSVKAKLGHIEAAAGVAGLIKTVLCIQHQQIPAHCSGMVLHPEIDKEHYPVQLVLNNTEWTKNSLRRAGISSFGLTGTNAHIILEEFRDEQAELQDQKNLNPNASLFVLSAKSKPALIDLVNRYLTFLFQSNHCIGDICYTAAVGRDHYPYRLAKVFCTKEELCSFLQDFLKSPVMSLHAENNEMPFVERNNLKTGDFDAYWNSSDSVQDVVDRIRISDVDQVTFSHSLFDVVGQDHYEQALHVLANLYKERIHVEWRGVYSSNQFHKVDLPLYPFQRVRIWTLPQTNSSVHQTSSSNICQIQTEYTSMNNMMCYKETVKQTVIAIVQDNEHPLKEDIPLSEQGFDSISGQELRHALESKFQIQLPSSFFYNYPTIESMAEGLKKYQNTASCFTANKKAIGREDNTGTLELEDTGDSGFQHLDDLDDDALAKLIDEDLKNEV